MTPGCDVVVVGAGPYGLSAAAHLLGRGLQVAVYGTTMGMWRHHMPKGMRLRSHWWATNLSDPRAEYGMEQYFASAGLPHGHPMPIETFIDYGHWFQQQAVPEVDETHVAAIERRDGRFDVTLRDGRSVQGAAIVMATGPYFYAHRPESFGALPAERVSHSCEHADFGPFRGREVVVIGGGQSAIESAALLVEAGATVRVVCRRPISWWAPDRMAERTLRERLVAPNASIAPGWKNWVLDHQPYLFHRLPQAWKDSYNSNYTSGASDWLHDRVVGKATLHEGRTVSRVAAAGDRLQATLSDGATISADHVLLATGYRVDIGRLPMIHPSLRAEIRADAGIPFLNSRFESSVPGLYFVGLTSLRSFGPLYRFVAGCGAAARRVAGAIATRARTRQAP